jgi:hypothetical protein
MSLNELLVAKGLASALIVDDAYDQVPRAEDLAADDDAWANFFADLGDDSKHLADAFPGFSADPSELRRSDEFVAVVWSLKAALRPELWDGLFDRYLRTSQGDREYLERLEAALRGFGVDIVRAGRGTVPEQGKTAPIIFADLFLGSAQSEQDIETSIGRLRALIGGREKRPPLVVLMSRSARLAEKKKYFRDSVPLLSALFRVHTKQSLLEGATLRQTLERLARHYDDAIRLAAFIQSWDVGLESAKNRFLSTIRRLDLADYGQIRRLLLDFEDQPIGSYLLDVFDRVLQHQIEADPDTIAAAEALNLVDANRYPPPYIAGTPDLQDLVYQCIYQNPQRLVVKSAEGGAPVSFGDILIKRAAPLGAGAAQAEEVLVVLTPACDLARAGAKRVLLMSGTCEDLSPKTWSYKSSAVRTPILKFPDGRRVWVRWNLKDLRAMPLDELTTALGAQGELSVGLRLRDGQALELQQRLLSDLGRVGLVAPMPATFPVAVEMYFVAGDDTLTRLPLTVVNTEGGVCYMGRDAASNSVTKLVLSESACQDVFDATSQIDINAVHASARPAMQRLRDSVTFATLLETGIDVPPPSKTGWSVLQTGLANEQGEISQVSVGLVRRNPESLDVITQMRTGGLLIVVKDLQPETAAAMAANAGALTPD